MIDLHSHVIYDVDTGSKNVEQTMRMLKEAQEVGYDAICFTPSYAPTAKTSKNILEKKLERIRELCKWDKISMDLYLGEEVELFNGLEEKLDDVLFINNTRYLLINLPKDEDITRLNDTIYKLQSYGKVLILAHPETYKKGQKDFKFLEAIAQKGILFQLNVNSLIGHNGFEAKKVAEKLIKKDMIQLVSSDAHSFASYYKAKEGLIELRKLVSEDKYMRLTSINPNKILLDMEVDSWQKSKIEQIKLRGSFFVRNIFRK